MQRNGHHFVIVLSTIVLSLAFGCPALADEPRIALLIGNNLAGTNWPQLRWAEADAQRLAQVLIELGGFAPDRVELMTGAKPEAVRAALAGMAAKTRALPRAGSLAVIYYSGHADGDALLFGDERLTIAELKERAHALPAEVVLIILDACNAGAAGEAAVRTKGGRSAPSFLHLNQFHQVRGRILLAAAAANELAQEADDIGGSVFTHFLLSGLRGEADQSNDGQVSLDEVYAYVYNRTVQRTVDSLPGVQHPSFSYDMKGKGGVILTRLDEGSSGLSLPAETEGSFLVFDRRNQQVVAEIQKKPGAARTIPLSAGAYTIKKRDRDHLLVADLVVPPGERITLREPAMRRVAFADPATKGWNLALRRDRFAWETFAWASWTSYVHAPAGGVWSCPTAGVGLRLADLPAADWNLSIGVGAGANSSEVPLPEQRLPFQLLQVDAWAGLGREFEWRWMLFELGARVDGRYLARRFDEQDVQGQDEALGLGPTAYLLSAVAVGRYRVGLELQGGVLFFPGADRVVVPQIGAGLSFGVGL